MEGSARSASSPRKGPCPDSYPTQALPTRPNLDHYRKRAKELVKAVRAGDARAFTLMREHHPRLKHAGRRAAPHEIRATFKQMQDGFTWACEYGRSAVVEFLLQRGVG